MISKNQIKYVHQLELKKFRKRDGVFVAEGPKVVGDLLRAGFEAVQLYATSEWQHEGQQAQEVSDEELRKISFLQHPQQVLAVFRMKESPAGGSDLMLALDGVQDPGNLGTIIRIADWFGITTIYCSEDTADAWNPKVVQATMGSIARVNIIYNNIVDLLSHTNKPVYGTLLDGTDIYGQQLADEGFIVMGNEGNGISEEVRELVSHRLLIPKYHEGPESLNVAVATAVVCAEFRRQDRMNCMMTAGS